MQDVAVLEHAADLHALKTLKLPERQGLFLKALGYRYHEIAQLTGSTCTAVNRRLTEGRRRLRELRHNSDEPT
jgi:DNA-directed RNA polymerase specialized sigma24 family protein